MKREVANIGFGFSVENVRFMKPGDRSRSIALATCRIGMSCNKLELCAVLSMKHPGCHLGSSGFIMGELGNTRQCCSAMLRLSCKCRASYKQMPHKSRLIIGGKKHGSNTKNQNQVESL